MESAIRFDYADATVRFTSTQEPVPEQLETLPSLALIHAMNDGCVHALAQGDDPEFELSFL